MKYLLTMWNLEMKPNLVGQNQSLRLLDNLNLEWLKVKLIDIAHWISGIIIRISARVVFRIYNILFLNYETKIYVFTDNDFISFLLGPISKTQFSGYIFENIQLVLKYACKYKCSKTPI